MDRKYKTIAGLESELKQVEQDICWAQRDHATTRDQILDMHEHRGFLIWELMGVK